MYGCTGSECVGVMCKVYLHTSLTPRNSAVSSCVLSERPAKARQYSCQASRVEPMSETGQLHQMQLYLLHSFC